MAITTGTQFERHEAANGRFLNVIEHKSSSTTPTEVLDISGLVAMREEALSYIDIIKTTPSNSGFLFDGLKSVLTDIQDGLQIDGGTLKIDALQKAACSRLGATGIGQYQQAEELGGAFMVPAEKITAAQVLSFQEIPRHFNPQIDLRIKSDTDKPVTVFEGPGQVTEQESLGRWYRFPLAETVVVALVSRKPQ